MHDFQFATISQLKTHNSNTLKKMQHDQNQVNSLDENEYNNVEQKTTSNKSAILQASLFEIKPNAFNRSYLFRVGEAPHHIMCHGILTFMIRRSKLCKTMFHSTSENELQDLTQLSFCHNLPFDTQTKKEALYCVWNHINGFPYQLNSFDRGMWWKWKQHDRMEIRNLTEIIESTSPNLPPILNPISSILFDHRFEMLQHMIILMDSFETTNKLDGQWYALMFDLINVCPYRFYFVMNNNNNEIQEHAKQKRLEIETFLKRHMELRLKQQTSLYKDMNELIQFMNHQCCECGDVISIRLTNQWLHKNGLRFHFDESFSYLHASQFQKSFQKCYHHANNEFIKATDFISHTFRKMIEKIVKSIDYQQENEVFEMI
jgi:hypothetical protein